MGMFFLGFAAGIIAFLFVAAIIVCFIIANAKDDDEFEK